MQNVLNGADSCANHFLLQPLFGSIQGMQNVLNGADTDVVNLATTEVQ